MLLRTFRALIYLSLIFNTWCEGMATDYYWIAFNSGRDREGPPPSAGPKHLMKIDMFGNTIVPSQKVIQNSSTYHSPGNAGIGISSQNEKSLNLWIPDSKNPSGDVSRALINKQTLRLIFLQKTSLNTNNVQYLQVTQRPENNFLALLINEANYIGFSVSPTGTPTSSSWMLTSNPTDCLGCPYSVSSDGKFMLISDLITSTNPNKQKLLIQRLGPMGHPIAKPVPLPTGGIPSANDISGPLPNGQRYVLYSLDGSPSSPRNRPMFLQVINSAGTPVGERNQIGLDVVHYQSAAIDPKGRFVIYITREFDGSDLVYQALDVIGRPSGAPRVLARHVSNGVDLLKDP